MMLALSLSLGMYAVTGEGWSELKLRRGSTIWFAGST
jgi:hypothetical protein